MQTCIARFGVPFNFRSDASQAQSLPSAKVSLSPTIMSADLANEQIKLNARKRQSTCTVHSVTLAIEGAGITSLDPFWDLSIYSRFRTLVYRFKSCDDWSTMVRHGIFVAVLTSCWIYHRGVLGCLCC